MSRGWALPEEAAMQRDCIGPTFVPGPDRQTVASGGVLRVDASTRQWPTSSCPGPPPPGCATQRFGSFDCVLEALEQRRHRLARVISGEPGAGAAAAALQASQTRASTPSAARHRGQSNRSCPKTSRWAERAASRTVSPAAYHCSHGS